jgi:predicted transposase/invertase (TIGR01784 family)
VSKIKFAETDDIIDICHDNVFKAVFTKESPQSRGALEKLLSGLIGRSLTVNAITANEPPIDDIHDRQIRFDINCKSKNGDLINIEMTLYPDDFEPVRLEFYAGKLFTGQNIRGIDKSFDDLKPAYQISFLVHKSFFADDEIVHNFEYYDKEHQTSLGGRSRIITVELNKLDKIIEEPVEKMTTAERWSIFLRYITDTTKRQTINEILEIEEGIAMASEVLISISKDEIERARLMSEFKFEVDHQSKMTQARRVGLTEGRNELLSLLKSGKSPDEIIGMYDLEKQ